MSRSDLTAADSSQFDEKGREAFSGSDSGSIKDDFLGVSGISLQDKGWISPPDSIYSSSSESAITSGEASLPDSSNNPVELTGQHPHGLNQGEEAFHSNFIPSSQNDFQEISDSGQSVSKRTEVNNTDSGSVKFTVDEPIEYFKAQESPTGEAVSVAVGSSQPLGNNSEVKFGVKDEVSSVNKVGIEEENNQDHVPNTHTVSRVARGK